MIRRASPWTRAAATAAALLGLLAADPAGRAAQEPPDEEEVARIEARLRENQRRIQSFLPPKPPPPDEPPPEDGGPAAFMYTTDQAIAMLRGRVDAEPGDFVSLYYLGVMLDRKARESGDASHFAAAEEALRRSLALLPEFPKARAALAMVLNARHQFAEARTLAEELVRDDPRDLDALAILGDAQLELGRYDEAEQTYARLARLSQLPEVLARLANFAELTGHPDEAIRLLERALEQARSYSAPAADAWYLVRLGDVCFATGKLDKAEEHYADVPEGCDPFHDATAGLARVRAAQGKTAEAIALYEKAVAIGPDPHMVTGLAELYRLAGREAEADAALAKLEADLKQHPEEIRHLARLYCDEGRHLPEALTLARRDFDARQDVDAYATLAWALHKNDRHDEAVDAIEHALKIGHRDAPMHYRAALIFDAAGDPDRSLALLREALAINPHFSPTLAPDASRRLAASAPE